MRYLLCVHENKNMSNQERIDTMESQLIDMRLAVIALLETAAVHQRNSDTLVMEIRNMRADMVQMQSGIREIWMCRVCKMKIILFSIFCKILLLNRNLNLKRFFKIPDFSKR